MSIAFALGEHNRLDGAEKKLRLEDYSTLTFERPDTVKFPCLSFARLCLSRGGTTACAVNAANEIAVAAFLEGKIRFTDIYQTIITTLENSTFVAAPGYEDYVAVNAEARAKASEYIDKLN